MQRRVLAARALRKNPEAAAALKEGKVSVTTLALFQEFNQKAKLSQATQSDHDKKNPDCPALEGALFGGKTGNEDAKINHSSLKLESIFGLSKLQTERKLFVLTGVNLKEGLEKKKQVTSTQTQVTLTLTELQLKKLELAKGRLAHRLKQNTYAELIELLAEIVIEQTTPKVRITKKPSEPTSLAKCPDEPSPPTARPVPAKLNTRYIPHAIKAKIWQKSGGKCERCKSTYALQIDHVVPYSLSANSSADNLRLLCRACNLAEAQIWGVLGIGAEPSARKQPAPTPRVHANNPICRAR